ncbi:hypothetical protein ACP4OV_003306 [Aristida adscensionis]
MSQGRRAELEGTSMASDTSNFLLYTKRILCSSIRLGYQSACDYPIVLGAGILLLFLHKLFPALFAFLLSSSPVFLLTALLLGALLSYGEPCAPLIGDEIVEKQETLSPKSNVSITNYSDEEVENADVKIYTAKKFESHVGYTEERTFDGNLHDIHCDQENVTSMSLSADNVLSADSSELNKNDVVVEREEHVKEVCEKVELQQFESTDAERCNYELNNQYQFGELMSSCWQPVSRQDPCSDSESDFTESSSDASMTDIIPMLDELNHPSVDLGTGHPSSTPRDNLQSSSDDDEDNSEEDGDHSSNEDGTEEKEDVENDSKDVNDVNSSDTENSGNLKSSMEQRRAKNILKFELDKRLMDMQAADAIQKMEEASRFRVQVPSISTPRQNLSGPSNGSEEIVELPQIPDSAPSVLPWRKPFDIPFDQIVDNDRQLLETWTPRSYFPSTQHRKHGNLHMRESTCLRRHSGIDPEKPELSGKDACDSHSDSDSERTGNNGKLFGTLEAHIGEEIKILSSAISDACPLEVNCVIDGGIKNIEFNDGTDSFYFKNSAPSTSEKTDPVAAGSEQPVLCLQSKEENSERSITEGDSITEVNSLFKCRMEEVLVQSISESAIGQPLTVKLEDEVSDASSADFGMPVIEASSVEELNSQLAQLNEEAFSCAASGPTSGNEFIQDRTSEELPVNGHTYASELQIEDRPSELLTIENQQAGHISEIQVIEASSIEDINSLMKQHCEEAQKTESYVQNIEEYTTENLSTVSDQPGYISELHVVEASSLNDITAALGKLHGEVEMHIASDPTIKLEDSSGSGLHVVETRAVAEENGVVKQFDSESQMEAISDLCLEEPNNVKVEGRPNELLNEDGELPPLEAGSVEEMSSLSKQVEEEVQVQKLQISPSSEHNFGQQKEETASDLLPPDSCLEQPKGAKVEGRPNELLTEDGELPVLEAGSVEEMSSLFKQVEEEVRVQKLQMSPSSEHNFGQQKEETASDVLPDAQSSEDVDHD